MLKALWQLLRSLLIILFLLTLAIAAFINFAPVFGGKADATSLERIKASTNFNGEIFENLIPTQVQTPSDEEFSVAAFFSPPEGKNPDKPLPAKRFDKASFKNGDFVWFGHSTVLTRTENVTFLTDPVFYSSAPVSFLVKPFAMQIENQIGDLPNIDVVLISHDHYDHLDYRAIQELDVKVQKYLVPLGIKAHLQRWGIADDKIVEMDWYEEESYESVRFTLTPSRHFSGRGLTDRFSTLWGSWVVRSSSLSIFYSGDSGYFDEFKKIGGKYGPFDIAFLEDGAYNLNWTQIHMMPEESVQASIDLNAKAFFPVHWGKFDLSVHQWTEPAERALKEAKVKNVNMVLPYIGETFDLSNLPQREWWKEIE